jgi:hypothetical protein
VVDSQITDRLGAKISGCGIFQPTDVLPLQAADFVLHSLNRAWGGVQTPSLNRLSEGCAKRNIPVPSANRFYRRYGEAFGCAGFRGATDLNARSAPSSVSSAPASRAASMKRLDCSGSSGFGFGSRAIPSDHLAAVGAPPELVGEVRTTFIRDDHLGPSVGRTHATARMRGTIEAASLMVAMQRSARCDRQHDGRYIGSDK